MTVVVYHNPSCGTSRNTLAMVRATGVEPTIIEYLKAPPTREELQDLVRRMGMKLRDIIRQKARPMPNSVSMILHSPMMRYSMQSRRIQC